MRISAKVDYAVRACIELAAAQEGEAPARPVKAEALARAQEIPLKFLENILRPAAEIVLADVIRAIDGPLTGIGGRRPEDVRFTGTAEPLREVWIAVRASLRRVLEGVSLADVVAGEMPAPIGELIADPGAWDRR